MSNAKIMTYSTSESIPNGLIFGKLYNTVDRICQVGLYKIDSDSKAFICSVENNADNQFEFKNISYGEYVLIGIEGSVANIENEKRNVTRFLIMGKLTLQPELKEKKYIFVFKLRGSQNE